MNQSAPSPESRNYLLYIALLLSELLKERMSSTEPRGRITERVCRARTEIIGWPRKGSESYQYLPGAVNFFSLSTGSCRSSGVWLSLSAAVTELHMKPAITIIESSVTIVTHK